MIRFHITLGLILCLLPPAIANDIREYDIVVYGGTAAGVTAAVQAARMGKSVLLIEPGRHIGGLTSGGLGATDIGNKAAIGGLSREFYRRVAEYYSHAEVWTFEKREDYRSYRRRTTNEKEMWTFEPHVAERLLRRLLDEHNVPILFEERLDLKSGATKTKNRIDSIHLESGLTIRGRMFIDATYEGDLLAQAGVSYHIGRESNATYDETLNGIQTVNAVHHQFTKPVDPYVTPGDPSSGLLPGVCADDGRGDGAGDDRVQAYCFRLCTTDVPRNRRPWPKPADYDPLRYELLLRNCEAGDHRVPWHPLFMPNRKTDTNNNFAISTDNIGMNYDYPDGDYETRARIFAEHVNYQQGLMWTLANSPRVPVEVREHFQRLGLAKDEFVDNDNWPHQLYVREARRMISEYVMTQHDCQARRIAYDPVGMAAYTMDSHNVQRYASDGRVWNEGDVQVGGFSPFPIAYRSIRPKQDECENLLVPVCLSASHIAYGSIRMEPVFMVLGQSAATAAAQAIDQNVAVQQIDGDKLQQRLKTDQQVLAWTGPKKKPPIAAASLPGIVIDDRHAELTGAWNHSASVGGYIGYSYRHDSNTAKGTAHAIFRPDIKTAGRYEVRIAYTPNPNRASNVPVAIVAADGKQTVLLNQRKKPNSGNFQSIGTFRFTQGNSGHVLITNKNTNGYVIIDAVQFLPK